MTFDEQFPLIIERLSATLAHAGASWKKVVRASFFLYRENSVDLLREHFRRAVSARIPETDYTLIDLRQGKHLEIELTAKP